MSYSPKDHLLIVVGDIETLPPNALVNLSDPDKLVVSVEEAEKMTGIDLITKPEPFPTKPPPLKFEMVVKQDYDRDFFKEEPQPWKRKGKNGYKNRY